MKTLAEAINCCEEMGQLTAWLKELQEFKTMEATGAIQIQKKQKICDNCSNYTPITAYCGYCNKIKLTIDANGFCSKWGEKSKECTDNNDEELKIADEIVNKETNIVATIINIEEEEAFHNDRLTYWYINQYGEKSYFYNYNAEKWEKTGRTNMELLRGLEKMRESSF